MLNIMIYIVYHRILKHLKRSKRHLHTFVCIQSQVYIYKYMSKNKHVEFVYAQKYE